MLAVLWTHWAPGLMDLFLEFKMQKPTNAEKVWIWKKNGWQTLVRINFAERSLDLVWVNFAGEPEVAVAGLQARGRTTGFCRRIAIQPLFTGHCLQEAPSSDAPNRQRSDVVRWFNGSLHEAELKQGFCAFGKSGNMSDEESCDDEYIIISNNIYIII